MTLGRSSAVHRRPRLLLPLALVGALLLLFPPTATAGPRKRGATVKRRAKAKRRGGRAKAKRRHRRGVRRARGRRAKAKRRRRRGRRHRRGRRRRRRRCDIFCTTERVRMDKRGRGRSKLRQEQVERVVQRHYRRFERCLVNARRRNPRFRRAAVDVVVDRRGRVLASRVNGRRRSRLARCIGRRLRRVRFPRSGRRRTVASFRLAINH